MPFFIKKRHNPQTGTYYVAYGKIAVKRAKSMENSLYGSNEILRYETKQDYETKIEQLKLEGERIMRT